MTADGTKSSSTIPTRTPLPFVVEEQTAYGVNEDVEEIVDDVVTDVRTDDEEDELVDEETVVLDVDEVEDNEE